MSQYTHESLGSIGAFNMIYHLALLCMFLLAFETPLALSVELIPQGPQAKASAGASTTVVTGPMAVFYNPANLGISGQSQVDFDFSLAQYAYEYRHTNQEKFKPVLIKSTVPPMSFGGTTKISEVLTLGLGLLPTGTGSKMTVIDIPLYLGAGLYQIADVEVINSGYKVLIGSAYRPFPWILMGVSITRIAEKSDTAVFKAGEIYPFLKIITEGVFYRPTLGITSKTPLQGLLIGMTFSPMLVKKYKGKFLFDLIGEDQAQGNFPYQPAHQVDVLPQTTGLGLQWRENSWTLFTEVVFEQWRVAQNQLTRGLPIASPKQDLKNTLNTYLGGSFKVSDHEIKISYGYEPSNLGDGQKFVKSTAIPSEQQASDVTVEGMTFGNISGINRSIFGLGWQRKLEFLSSQKTKIPGYGALGFYSMSGSRTVPEGFSQEGTYKINLNMFTFGGAYRL